MFKKMPFILIAIIATVIFTEPYLPLELKQFLYYISMVLKTIIVTILPLIIFGLLFKTTVSLSGNATKIIGIILALVCCSNFLSSFLSHFVGEWISHFNVSMITPKESSDVLQPIWAFNLPKIIANDKAMFAAIFFGLIGSKFFSVQSKIWAEKFENVVTEILNIFVLFIPLFVTGFVIKLQHDDVMNLIIKDYGTIFAIIACAQYGYILLGYILLNKGSIPKALENVKNMIPAAISGFSTMSSAASMPLTIIGAEANAKDKDLARSVIPATVNIHLVGDCFAIPIFAYAVINSFGLAEPTLANYLVFNFYFVLAKFSVAAIPGGGILVMLPILEAYLGFSADMMLLITALYIIFDPVITSANVFGNGLFAKMIDTLMTFKFKQPLAEMDTVAETA